MSGRLVLFILLSFLKTSFVVPMSISSGGRKFDLVIYGATGFTGAIAAEYVHKNYPSLKWALAGRNKDKLEAVRQKICGKDSKVPLIVADAVKNPESLDELAASTKVVANYAGSPFADKGLPLVEACAKLGTCYTDITGEAPFHRLSYDRYHKEAEKSGALIIHSCGFDSIPSDLGAMLAAKAMKERHNCECESIELVLGDSSGGPSGGTIETVLYLLLNGDVPGMKECSVRGSYALDPEGGIGGPDTADTVSFVQYDPLVKTFVMPFVVASANAPVVRKSNALFGYRYGKNCSYREVAKSGLLTGLLGLLGMGMFGALVFFPPTRWLLKKYVLPKPGEGPTKEQQDNGFFDIYVYAVGDTPEKPVTVAYVKSGNAGDPGYKATARMSIESSLCMVLDREKCAKGGVLTTATGLGLQLVERLNMTGMKLGVEAPNP